LLAEAVNGRICPLEGRYNAVAPSGGVTTCYSYLNIGCDVISVIDVIDTCSRTPGALVLNLLHTYLHHMSMTCRINIFNFFKYPN